MKFTSNKAAVVTTHTPFDARDVDWKASHPEMADANPKGFSCHFDTIEPREGKNGPERPIRIYDTDKDDRLSKSEAAKLKKEVETKLTALADVPGSGISIYKPSEYVRIAREDLKKLQAAGQKV